MHFRVVIGLTVHRTFATEHLSKTIAGGDTMKQCKQIVKLQSDLIHNLFSIRDNDEMRDAFVSEGSLVLRR